MAIHHRVLSWAAAAFVVGAAVAGAANLGTAFTYQGRLVKNGTPVSDTCDFTLGLWDAPTLGNQKGNSPQGPLSTVVADGLFTVTPDFGPGAIDGDARWLEITVQCPGDGSATTLSPRVELTPVPHALALAGMRTPQTASTPNVVGGTTFNNASTGAVGATISGGGFHGFVEDEGGGQVLLPDEHLAFDDYSVIGGGSNNTAGTDDGVFNNASFTTIGGGYGNVAQAYYATIGGGFQNMAIGGASVVGGGNQNFAGSSNATVAGGLSNAAGGDRSTVGGGWTNVANGALATIGGGDRNIASQNFCTAAGGSQNTASELYATVGGGWSSTAGGSYSTVAGGGGNLASNNNATVGGGLGNSSLGNSATVPGGAFNQAGGDYSFAAGNGATVRNAATVGGGDIDGDQGTFVWSDSLGSDPTSTGPYQFLIDAAGGVGINTNAPQTVLHVVGGVDASLTAHGYLVVGATASSNIVIDDNEIIARSAGGASTLTIQNNGGNIVISGAALNSQVGINRSSMSHPLHVGTNGTNGNGAHLTAGGVWTNGSDRNSKEAFEPLNPADILARVVTLSVTRWRYKGEPETTRHIGPVAQDFYAAFGTGGDERYIGTIDADGVALAAIQGLHEIVEEIDCRTVQMIEAKLCEAADLKSELSDLRVRNLELGRKNDVLEGRNTELETRLRRLEEIVGKLASSPKEPLP